MHKRHRIMLGLALAAMLVIAAAACGSSSNKSSSVPTGAQRSSSNTTSSTAAPSTAPATAGQALNTTSQCPASAKLPANAVDKGGANATGATVHVDAGDTFFTPTCVLKVAPNTTVTLVVRNTGQMLHNVSVPAQGIDKDVPVGQTVTVHVKVGTAPVAYFCKYHQSLGMTGSLVPA